MEIIFISNHKGAKKSLLKERQGWNVSQNLVKKMYSTFSTTHGGSWKLSEFAFPNNLTSIEWQFWKAENIKWVSLTNFRRKFNQVTRSLAKQNEWKEWILHLGVHKMWG